MLRLRRLSRGIAAAGLAFALAACASGTDEEYEERPVESLYNEAVDELEAENYGAAARAFDEVERQHPYSVWATKAQIMAAYAQYLANAYDEAIVALDRFIQLHPGNKDAAYAYYLKALSYYEQISDVERDQRMTQRALDSLQEVVTRFPDTDFARDAELKIDLTRDHLAGKEMRIGRYYLNQGHYLAAVNRFKVVVDTYQTTTHVPEALHRLTEAYMALGLHEEAEKTASVLGYNFPGSEWYIDSYEMMEGEVVRTPEEQAKLEEPWWKLF